MKSLVESIINERQRSNIAYDDTASALFAEFSQAKNIKEYDEIVALFFEKLFNKINSMKQYEVDEADVINAFQKYLNTL